MPEFDPAKDIRLIREPTVYLVGRQVDFASALRCIFGRVAPLTLPSPLTGRGLRLGTAAGACGCAPGAGARSLPATTTGTAIGNFVDDTAFAKASRVSLREKSASAQF